METRIVSIPEIPLFAFIQSVAPHYRAEYYRSFFKPYCNNASGNLLRMESKHDIINGFSARLR